MKTKKELTASDGRVPRLIRPQKYGCMKEYLLALQGNYPRDRLAYWWAWHKHDIYRHAITIAAVCIAIIIGSCVFNSLSNAESIHGGKGGLK